MSKVLKQNNLRGRHSVRALIFATALSVVAFGCTTNHIPSSGQPAYLAPAGGSSAPSLSATPGTAASIPSTMISAGVDPAVDAVAVLEANRSFEGRVLGPAAPGNGVRSSSQQVVTGQFIHPALLVNPQLTVNRSMTSGGVPAIVSGAGEIVGGTSTEAVIAGAMAGPIAGGATGLIAGGASVNAGTTAAATTGATIASVGANFGATGLSNTTATGLTNATTAMTNIASGTNAVVSTGLAAAPTTASAVLATPTLGTAARLNVDNTATAFRAANTVRLVNSDGRVVVTNQPTTTTTTRNR